MTMNTPERERRGRSTKGKISHEGGGRQSPPFSLRQNMECKDVKKEELLEEEKKMRRLRFIVDLTQAILMQSDLTMREAFDLLGNTKKAALLLFPDKEAVYELLYAPRFRRIVRERFVIPGGPAKKLRK